MYNVSDQNQATMNPRSDNKMGCFLFKGPGKEKEYLSQHPIPFGYNKTFSKNKQVPPYLL